MILVACAVLLVAGCLGSTRPESTPSPDQAATGAPVAGQGGQAGLPLPNTGAKSFQFLNCSRVLMTMEVPLDWAAEVVPKALTPYGLTDDTATVAATFERCPRTRDNETVYGETSQYWAFVFVRPVNASWTQPSVINWYVLDYATDSKALKGSMVASGLHVDGAVIAATATATAAGTITDVSATTPTYSVKAQYPRGYDNPQWSGGEWQLWFGQESLHRIQYHNTYHGVTVLAAGTLQLDGSSRLQAATRTSTQAWTGSTYDDDTALWRVDPKLYPGMDG